MLDILDPLVSNCNSVIFLLFRFLTKYFFAFIVLTIDSMRGVIK